MRRLAALLSHVAAGSMFGGRIPPALELDLNRARLLVERKPVGIKWARGEERDGALGQDDPDGRRAGAWTGAKMRRRKLPVPDMPQRGISPRPPS